MADKFPLAASVRETSKKSARDTRASGRVPGVVYGHGFDSKAVSVAYSDLLRTYRKAGNSAIVDLDIEGEKVKVLVQKVDLDPVRDDITHVDFLKLNLKEVTTVTVPLVFVGEAPAVKNFGGIFMHNYESLDIRCLPTDIPHDIQVDISSLEDLHDHLCVKDLNLDEAKYEIMGGIEPETVICTVTGRAAEEEETTTEGEGEGEEGEGAEGETEGEGEKEEGGE